MDIQGVIAAVGYVFAPVLALYGAGAVVAALLLFVVIWRVVRAVIGVER